MLYSNIFAKNNVTSTKNYNFVFFNKGTPPNTPYGELNSIIVPTPSSIQLAQIEKIRILQKNAFSKTKLQNSVLNRMIQDGSLNSALPFYLEGQEYTLSEALNKLVDQIHSLGINNRRHLSENTKMSTYKGLNTKLRNLSNILNSLSKQLNINSPIYDSYLEQIDSVIKSCEIADSGSINQWANKIYNMQGDIVEILGTAYLNKVPQLQTIKTATTGGVNLQGENLSAGRHKGQIIQDLLSFNMSDIDVMKTQISYTTVGGEPKTATIKEFIDILNGIKKSETIIIDDDAYTTLLELSTLNTQAKSGKNQLPWNVSLKSKIAATSVSIGEFDNQISSGLGIRRAFELLHTLNQDEDLDIADKSADYNALANYGLSSMLAKVLHLSEKEGNQILLTPSGFITYTERLEQLFKDGEDYVMFVEDIILSDSTLTQSYHVTLASKPRGY